MHDAGMTHVTTLKQRDCICTIFVICKSRRRKELGGGGRFLLSFALQLIFPVLHFVILFVQLFDAVLDLVQILIEFLKRQVKSGSVWGEAFKEMSRKHLKQCRTNTFFLWFPWRRDVN